MGLTDPGVHVLSFCVAFLFREEVPDQLVRNGKIPSRHFSENLPQELDPTLCGMQTGDSVLIVVLDADDLGAKAGKMMTRDNHFCVLGLPFD